MQPAPITLEELRDERLLPFDEATAQACKRITSALA